MPCAGQMSFGVATAKVVSRTGECAMAKKTVRTDPMKAQSFVVSGNRRPVLCVLKANFESDSTIFKRRSYSCYCL